MSYRVIHYLIPLLALSIAVISQYSGLDLWLAQQFYDQQQHLWPYQNDWLLQTVIHRGGRYLVAAFVIVTLLVFLMSFVMKRWRTMRLGAGYILLTSLTSLLIIAQLKNHTHLYSPWDLYVFGGDMPHIRLFDAVLEGTPVGYAFPAGHAGGGYILLSLYFLLREMVQPYRYLLLAVAVCIGMLFGIAQQVRGAHMLSHDLTTISICWLSCIVWAMLLFKSKQNMQTAKQDFSDSANILS